MDNNLVYHYCSTEVFLKILSGRKLRISDIRRSNDSEEIKFLFEKYLEEKKAEGEKAYLAVKGCDFIFREALKQETVFALSFSDKRDLLSQWRGYAPDGGVAIGFDRNELKSWAEKIISLGETAKFKNVEYYKKDDKRLKEILKKFNDPFLCNNYKNILKVAPLIKLDGFKEESEWRIYFNGFTFSEGQPLPLVNYENGQIEEECELGKNGKVKFFYSIPFSADMIEEILISPKGGISVEDMKGAIACFWEDLGKNVAAGKTEINVSELSYR
mgnify:CR=1 FL=1